jgi:pyruvate/2-oxoglutarate dehydrogenase complex dihydrolipoamide dehydrogenase (E3) component
LALAKEGWKIAVIEKKYVGGSCINYGCTPTKTMIASAKMAYLAKHSKELGIKTGKTSIDFAKIVERKNKIVKSFRDGSESQLEKNKNIKLYFGTASFSAPKEIEINYSSRTEYISANYIFINTGIKPAIPEIEGLNKIKYLTSESILKLKKVPEKLIVIGGSYVGLEFAQMFSRFGAEAAVIEKAERFLPQEDEDIADELRKILEEEGIQILTHVTVKNIKKIKKDQIKVEFGNKSIQGTDLLIAAGVEPNTSSLNLAAAGIETDEKGYIKVNNKLETNVSGVFALGDVKGGPAFTHISYDDYRIVYGNITKTKFATTERLIPYVLFTDPELARVGITEQEAKSKNLNYKTAIYPMSYVARAIETGETKGIMKAVIDAKTEKILGCAILCTHGGELMSMIEIAMMGGLTFTKLKDAIFAHPTLAESLNNLFTKIKM